MPRTPVYGGEYEYYSPEEEEIEEEIPEEMVEEEPQPGDILAHQPSQVELLRQEQQQLQQEATEKAETKELKRNIRRLKHPGFFESGEKMKQTGKKIAAVGSSFVGGFKQYVQRSADERDGKRIVANEKLQRVKDKTQQLSGGMGTLGTVMLTQDNQNKSLDLLSTGNRGSGLDLLGGSGSGLSLTGDNKKKPGINLLGGSGLNLLGGGDRGSGKTVLQAKAALSLFDESNRSGLLSFNVNKNKTGRKKKHRKRRKR